MLPQWIIEKKRDGHALDEQDIRFFIEGYSVGTIPDYQMAALAMAIFFRGMTFEEVTVLTDAMMHSGDLVDTSSIARPKVDKHSTGGIGDKVSLLLAPLAACCGVAVPMISGRGLGITGGTLDKLESIAGYRTDLSTAEFLAVLDTCGCSIMGQTANLTPADKKLYALRDVTGTVPSMPLISASIMSKKLAEGADALVLDVKWGKGAFMQSVAQARELATTMVRIGQLMGRGMAALVTDMNQPLGRSAGNALEVIETIEALRGHGPADLVELTLQLGARMLCLAGKAASDEAARPMLTQQLDSGAALHKFRDMVELHGGDVAQIDDPARLPRARLRREFTAAASGYVAGADALRIGKACIVLGAGRTRVTDTVDAAVGVSGMRKIGETVEAGAPLLMLHANSEEALAAACRELEGAFEIRPDPPPPTALVLETLT